MYNRIYHSSLWRYFIKVTIGAVLGSLPQWALSQNIPQSDVPRPFTIYVNTSLENIPDPSHLRAFRLITQAFSDLGYRVDFGFQPPKRMIESLENGKIDGLCLRASGMEKVKANILRIPVGVHQLKLFGYVNAAKAPESGLWTDAAVTTIGLSHGAQDPGRYIPKELLQRRFIRPPDSLTGARLVSAGRIDMVVLPEIFFHASEPVEHEILSALVKLEPALGSIATYCFLNRKQYSLVEPLTQAFTRLKSEDPQQFDDGRYPMVLTESEMNTWPPF